MSAEERIALSAERAKQLVPERLDTPIERNARAMIQRYAEEPARNARAIEESRAYAERRSKVVNPAQIVPAPTRLLTHSRAKSFRACNRKHHYAYNLHYRAIKQGEPLIVGDMFHKHCAEVYWRARKANNADLEGATQAAINSMTSALGLAVPLQKITVFVAAKLMVMTIAYTAAWNTRPKVQCLEVEIEFNAPLTFSGKTSMFWRMAGKIDAILRLEDGRIALCEHKTSSADVSSTSNYRRRLSLDEQISIYYEAAAFLGYPLDIVIYDVISKPKISPYIATPMDNREYTKEKSRACPECKRKKNPTPAPHEVDLGDIDKITREHVPNVVTCTDGRLVTDPGGRLYANMREFDETPDEYMARLLEVVKDTPGGIVTWAEVPRTDDQRKQFASIFKDTAKMMRWSIENAIHPPNSDACFYNGGSACDFIEVCEGTASLDDERLFVHMKDGHAELSKGDDIDVG